MVTPYYDAVIIGGGVTGEATQYILNRFTNLKRCALIEKNRWVGEVNSSPENNSQTSHDGSTETNYGLAHALKVRDAARILRRYVESKKDKKLFRKTNRMVLGVGQKEVAILEERFRNFSQHYPGLRLVGREELKHIEPKVIDGRDPSESVCALVSSEGYAINYQRLAEWFHMDVEYDENSEFRTYFTTSVENIIPHDGGDWFEVRTSRGVFSTYTLVAACGPYSLSFAQATGYGLEYGILPVAGSFYSTGHFLDGKVYRVQKENMPFAEIHGDPDILDPKDTRFGPTTKPLPLMERYNYGTFFDYIKTPIVSYRGLRSLIKILRENKLMGYVAKNFLYDAPIIGPLCFLPEAKKVIPTLRYGDLKRRRGKGGIRPQIVNLNTGKLEMGNKIIETPRGNGIFVTTPSPGASICMDNGKYIARKLVQARGAGYYFNEEMFLKEFEPDPIERLIFVG
ncbi:MAG: FAD-dependent oxidoreductase [Candidatus Sungbacteria bacterium]|nr:FAD-dependent oxidoreductase [Candidatus Sungbacteria bacterium]